VTKSNRVILVIPFALLSPKRVGKTTSSQDNRFPANPSPPHRISLQNVGHQDRGTDTTNAAAGRIRGLAWAVSHWGWAACKSVTAIRIRWVMKRVASSRWDGQRSAAALSS